MRRSVPIAALAALIRCAAWAQPAADEPAFEAASVKVSPPHEPGQYGFSWMRGGPGSPDPGRIDYRQISIDILVARAYDVPQWQLFGPDWTRLGHYDYDIAATVPPGASQEQFRLMLRRLLVERFKLQVHRETRELAGYSLSAAKGGPKLHPHVDAGRAAEEDKPLGNVPPPIQAGAGGYPILTARVPFASLDGKSRQRWDNAGVGELVDWLSAYLRAPVSDETGIQGKYDIDLYWLAPAMGAQSDDTGPGLFAAVQQQLGLKLEKKKSSLEVLVIDHAEKVPTGN